MEFPGVVYGDIRVPKLSRFYASTDGYAYNHSTEATGFGLKEESALTIKPQTVDDSNKRKIVNSDDVEFNAKLMQTNMEAIQSVFNLSRNYHNLFIPSTYGDFFSFIANSSSPATPNGSNLVGLHWKLNITKDARNLECKWVTRLFKNETVWLFEHMASISAPTATTGSAIGLNGGLVYNRDNYRESNFTDIQMNDISIGVFSDASLTIESSGFINNRNMELMQFINVTAEATLGQSASRELQASITNRNRDSKMVMFTPFGEQFRMLNGAVTNTSEFMHSDKEAHIKLTAGGEIARTLVSFSGQNMIMDFAG